MREERDLKEESERAAEVKKGSGREQTESKEVERLRIWVK